MAKTKVEREIKKYNPQEIEKKWPSYAKASVGKQKYEPSLIEAKWQKYWQENKTYQPDLDSNPSTGSASSLQAGSGQRKPAGGKARQGRPFTTS